jgi:hypothetical protein
LDNPQRSAYSAYGFMMLFGNSVSYWLMVKLAIAAHKQIQLGSDEPFYRQKVATAQFFATQLLTRNPAYLATVTGGIDYLQSVEAKDFITVQ